MNNWVFDICCAIIFVTGFAFLFGIASWGLELACKHIPALDAWVNSIAGIDDDDEDWGEV